MSYCKHVCLCICEHMFMCMCVSCWGLHMFVHVLEYKYLSMHECAGLLMHVCMPKYVHAFAYLYICAGESMFMQTCVCV